MRPDPNEFPFCPDRKVSSTDGAKRCAVEGRAASVGLGNRTRERGGTAADLVNVLASHRFHKSLASLFVTQHYVCKLLPRPRIDVSVGPAVGIARKFRVRHDFPYDFKATTAAIKLTATIT